ncbi:unnamed protein product [Litomosoides sigmodontis]|uniref:Uncharacterized protein n=1 Tax=Litomosoides sigmodontis TaxID=42156 RepID=A0A3P6SN45_LITSI|nr:unnamed protein product [Litomosoides sigmodontis]
MTSKMRKLDGKIEVGDRQVELILQNRPINLLRERKYSKLIASQEKMEQKSAEGMKYFRLKLLPEQYCYAEYYYPENEPYRVYFHKVHNHWFIYKCYQRISDQYAIDYFNARVYYMGVIPDDIMNRGDFYEINDFISTVSVLHGEYHRKLELQHFTGGGFRPNLRSMKGRKVLPTFLASYAREQQEDGKLRHLRILPSKYTYKPQATTVFGDTKVYSKGQSPNSWQNDWKMQSRHDEYDHRLTEATIPDVRDTRVRGNEQFAIRFNKELNKRIDFALADIEAVISTTMLNYKMDPRVIAACDSELPPTILDRHGDMTWVKNAETYISSVLSKDDPTIEEKKNFKSDDEKTLSFGVLRSGHAAATHLYINDSWRRIIDSNRIPSNALQILKLLITDSDAWPLDSDFSNLALVDRADRISVPRVIEFFHHYHLESSGMKVLAIGTLLVVIVLLMLFALILTVTQNKEDLGYCPSNVLGFHPANPHQMKWMEHLLNVRTPSKYDNSSVSATHFFMLDD